MLQVTYCKNCGKSKLEFGTVSIEVQLRYHGHPCSQCHESHIEHSKSIFCSPECLVAYTAKQTFVDDIDALRKEK